MKAEYLLFNLLVIAGPLALGFWKPTSFVRRWPRALLAATILAIPYIVWDAIVAGRHWDFNPKYVLGMEFFGLPVEEIMFFFTVPAACVFAWETLCKPHRERGPRPARPKLVALAVPFVFAGLWMWTLGKEYTSLSLIAFGAMILVDRLLDARLLGHWRFWCFLGLVSALTLIFNNYLTCRPVFEHEGGVTATSCGPDLQATPRCSGRAAPRASLPARGAREKPTHGFLEPIPTTRARLAGSTNSRNLTPAKPASRFEMPRSTRGAPRRRTPSRQGPMPGRKRAARCGALANSIAPTRSACAWC
jgi:lycopene cyclase domain-containing protein